MNFNDNNTSVYNGKRLKLSVFGASHAEEIGVTVTGLDNQSYDQEDLQKFLDRRKPKKSAYSTTRKEDDRVEVTNGLSDGKIKGEYRAVIKNNGMSSQDYQNTVKIPRPSHADFVAWTKYGDGFDYRGGGKFSGRLTAPICIAGGICKQLLEKKGIKINAYLSSIGKEKAKSYRDIDVESFDFAKLDLEFPVLDVNDKQRLLNEIERARASLDSVGGAIECVVTGVPVGTGEYMFDSIESVISHLAFAVPAVKGIEFGAGFDFCSMNGSIANDPFYYDGDKVKTKTNNNGGINGGMANGMPITFRVAVKPTPSIAKEQDTVDLNKRTNVKLCVSGRHDACIVPRAVPVIEAITAIAIYDLIQ